MLDGLDQLRLTDVLRLHHSKKIDYRMQCRAVFVRQEVYQRGSRRVNVDNRLEMSGRLASVAHISKHGLLCVQQALHQIVHQLEKEFCIGIQLPKSVHRAVYKQSHKIKLFISTFHSTYSFELLEYLKTTG